MNQKIAVAIIHGIGDQGPQFANDMLDVILKKFRDALPRHDNSIHDKISIRPIFWADILSRKERILWNSLRYDSDLNYQSIRRFLFGFLGDAIAYQPGRTRRAVYNRIHQRCAEVLGELAADAGPEAPLCVIAHSLGTIITHNFFYDLGEDLAEEPDKLAGLSELETGQTLALVYTLGSPLAVWSLRYDDYDPFPFPGRALKQRYPRLKPKWTNLYDKDDIIAFPISTISRDHFRLAKRGFLEDIQVNVGGFFSSWNPGSHTKYWLDRDVTEPIVRSLVEMWQASHSTTTPRL